MRYFILYFVLSLRCAVCINTDSASQVGPDTFLVLSSRMWPPYWMGRPAFFPLY